MRALSVLLAAGVLSACSRDDGKVTTAPSPAALMPPPAATAAPPGVYELDPAASKVAFEVEYVDLTRVAAQFAQVNGTLQFDPQKPESSVVSVTVDPASLRSPFAGVITSAEFLDTERYPEIAFRSTRIERTGADTADVTGDFTVHGVTKPLKLKVRFTADQAPGASGEARVRFTAEGMVRRSAYGVAAMLPQAGDPAGVLDEVDLKLEAEFVKQVPPALARINGSG